MKKLFAFCLGMIAFVFVHAQSDSTLKEFVGKYRFPDGSVVSDVSVSLDNGLLNMLSSAGSSVLEKASGEDTYAIVSFQGTAVFKRNDAKKIVGVIIDAMGYHLEGTKDESSLVFVLRKDNLMKNISK